MFHHVIATSLQNIVEANQIALNICIGVSNAIAHTCLCGEVYNDVWLILSEYCINYIQTNNGTGVDEFDTFSGGVASVVDNITNDIVYEEEIK